MSRADARRWWAAVALIWTMAAFLYWWIARDQVATWSFPDVDDEMRLQQVRDLLAGQSWFDVTQYRVNPPAGAPMHWSRWVDLPIAALLLLARPFAGQHGAELFACIGVPLVTLGAAILLAALLARRLGGPAQGLMAAALAPFTAGTLQQMHVLRIDHHGWQMVLAIGIVLAVVDRQPRRSGLIAGGCAALWLAISLEALPFVAAVGMLLGLRWLIHPAAERERFGCFALALGVGEAVLFAVTKAPATWGVIACDAVTLVHVGVLMIAAAGALLAVRFASAAHIGMRLAVLAATGLAALLCYRGLAPQCQAGAFAELDPLVRRFWYDNVPEGLPIWHQTRGIVASAIGFPILALIGGLVAWRRGTERAAWANYVILLATSIMVTLMVQRAGAAANLVAVPGGVWLMAQAVGLAQRIRATVPRVLASATVALVLTPISPALIVTALTERTDGKPVQPPHEDLCSTADYATASLLPPSTLFAPIDIGPDILIATNQRVVATGHHRNREGLHDVIAAFLADPADAEAIVRRHGAAYVVACPALFEMELYRTTAPHGLWAQLAAGRTPPWLRRVALPGSRLAVWKVVG